MQHYDKFREIHNLLKQFNCKATYEDEGAYIEGTNIILDGNIDAVLDVEIKTELDGAEYGVIRFNIRFTDKEKTYIVHISLPTHGRCIDLSKTNLTHSKEVIGEIEKWIVIAKCKKKINVKSKKKEVSNGWEYQQLSLI